MSNQPTKAQRERWRLIADKGCIICLNEAEIHHCFTSMGSKKDHDKVIPLCHKHHRTGGYGIAIHAGKKAWEKWFGTEQKHLETVEKFFDSLNK